MKHRNKTSAFSMFKLNSKIFGCKSIFSAPILFIQVPVKSVSYIASHD